MFGLSPIEFLMVGTLLTMVGGALVYVVMRGREK